MRFSHPGRSPQGCSEQPQSCGCGKCGEDGHTFAAVLLPRQKCRGSKPDPTRFHEEPKNKEGRFSRTRSTRLPVGRLCRAASRSVEQISRVFLPRSRSDTIPQVRIRRPALAKKPRRGLGKNSGPCTSSAKENPPSIRKKLRSPKHFSCRLRSPALITNENA
jgi:hypothetical protein